MYISPLKIPIKKPHIKFESNSSSEVLYIFHNKKLTGDGIVRIKNIELENLIALLDDLKLSGKASRMRTRFKNLLLGYYARFEQEKLDIIKNYAVLDEQGNFKTKQVGELQIPIWKNKESEQLANEEYRELCLEEIVIEETEERKDMLLSVKESILNCEIPFTGVEADLFDRYCQIFENINYGESE